MVNFEPDEDIILILRKHYFVLIPFVSLILIASILPLILYFSLINDFLPISKEFIPKIQNVFETWKVFGYSVWLLILWVIFFIEWTDYYLDFWVITNKRIIDAEQKGFFNREVISFRYEQIQDITVETKGVVGTFFKFGTLHIQTAGEKKDIIIYDADKPEEARSLILKLQERSRATNTQ